MNCPQCQFKMPFQERICRRCQYCADLGVYVKTDVPRSGRRRIEKKPLRHVMLQRLVPRSLFESRRVHPAAVLFASLVPGLGHALLVRRPEALFFLLVVAGLVYAALFSPWSASTSLAVLGLAFGLHVASIFRITTASDHLGLFSRVGMHLTLFVLLAVFIYSPLSGTLLTYKPELTYQRGVPVELVNSILYFAICLFLISWVLSGFVSLLLSRPEKRS